MFSIVCKKQYVSQWDAVTVEGWSIWRETTRRQTSSAKSRSVKELWPNATPIEQDSTVLSSNQSMPVANESGISTPPWRTPASILNHELWVPPVRTQLTELSYSTLKSLTILSGIPSLVRSSHNVGRSLSLCVAHFYLCLVMCSTQECQ